VNWAGRRERLADRHAKACQPQHVDVIGMSVGDQERVYLVICARAVYGAETSAVGREPRAFATLSTRAASAAASLRNAAARSKVSPTA
jgi:hypothetical protein